MDLLPTSASLSAQLAAAIGVSWAIYKICSIGRREKDLPPGPATLPLLGNLLSFPTKHIHLKLTEFSKQWGEIYSLKIASGTAIVITSPEAVRELLGVKGASTAGRPTSYVADMITGGFHVGVMPYNDAWRKLRRALHEVLSPKASLQFIPIQNAETAQLLNDILSQPEDFITHTNRYSGSIVLSVIAGQRAPHPSSSFIESFFKMERAWVEILAPGNTPPVDLVPFLTYFPEMFANWKVRARKIRDWQRQLYTTLVEGCKSRYKPGKSNANLLDTAYERSDEWGLTKEMIVSLGGATMEGGSGSTASFIQGFVLFMMAYPEVQRKAKEELDIVVGPHRKPTLDDIENLPYLRAVIKEMSRIRPIAPISMPHSILQEVYYKGYRLPADAMLFVNTYGIFHDEALFEDPEEFRPERYIQHPLGLKPNAEIDPVSARILETLPFSIGRRACPGIHVAINTVAISTVNLLWAFEFSKPKDELGNDIEPNLWDYAPGVVTGPNPFKTIIRPRSANHAKIIRRGYLDAQSSLEIFEQGLDATDKAWLQESRKLAAEQS